MIENLQNEHKQAKGVKLCVNIRCCGARIPQNFPQSTGKIEYEKSNNI